MENSINPNWLQLKNPKIILINSVSKSRDSLLTSSNIDQIKPVDPILKDNRENSLLQRIEKKNKYQHKTIDTLDPQKNKSKLKKKVRTKIHISEDEEDNIQIQTNFFDSKNIKGDNGISLPLMRPEKPFRKKISNNKKGICLDLETTKNTKKESKNVSVSSTKYESDNKVCINNPLSIQELSSLILIPEAEIIKWLFLQGMSVTINQIIDISIAKSIIEHYGFVLEQKDEKDTIVELKQFADIDINNELLEYRSPIVTILGHVDHGKTTLLDIICKTNNANIEVGGITQAISIHEIEIENKSVKKKIVFLDTPGHEAFLDMRIRCSQITDICVIVIAADDSLKQQSIEVIQYIQKTHIPFIVVINKIDKPNINLKKVKEDLANYDIISHDEGGNNYIIEASALMNKNIDLLLDTIITLAELQGLRANTNTNAVGTILDSYLDKTRGPVATILIKNGTLHIGDFIIVDNFISKIRVIRNRQKLKIDFSGPSSVAEIWGLSNIPSSGSKFEAFKDEKQAKKIISGTSTSNNKIRLDSTKKNQYNVSNEQINLILKTDTHGSINAIIQACNKIPQSKVHLNILSISVGKINEGDIQLASITKSTIISFNIIIDNNIKIAAEKSGIALYNFQIIYDLINYIQDRMLQLVKTEYAEIIMGSAIVENIFNVSKGIVAGCIVKSGYLKQNSYIRIKRNNVIIYNGKLNSLKKVKEDVKEVKSGNECGVLIFEFNQWDTQDEIESYELVPREKTLH